MADYFTHFSCVLDVGSPEKAIAALDLLPRLHLDEEGSDDPEYSGFALSQQDGPGSSILSVRPIQGSGRIALTQSVKLGMNPRSSRTCCSPTQRVGMILPVDSVIVGPKTVSESQIPAA